MSRSSAARFVVPALALALVTAAPGAAWSESKGGEAAKAPASVAPVPLGLGRPATPEEIRGWDIDVLPDGTGLPAGTGTVEGGQALYDAKCSSCHGVFGESNDWIPIAGGVKEGDIERGRAAALRQPDAMRTLGTKLNSAPSLWDYIRRSMPLTAPKTLTVDETYAITAYVLHLNEILPADARVDEKTLAGVRMPNRLGFTEDHGFKTRLGKPDVRNSACMAGCETDVRVSSQLPEHARNAHGNLREQMRWYGAIRGVDSTVPPGTSSELWRSGAFEAGRPAPQATAAANAASLVKSQGCTACHGMDTRIVGPGFAEIAARYQGDAAAGAKLVEKMKQGGTGVWGPVPMPAQPQLGDGDAHSIVRWILSGAKS